MVGQPQDYQSDTPYSDDGGYDLVELEKYLSDDDGDSLDGYEPPTLSFNMSTSVVVSNLPKVDSSKHDKLLGVLKRVLGPMGHIEEGGIMLPKNDNGETFGVALVNYSNPEEAKKAISSVNGWSLDKNHVLRVMPYATLDRLNNLPDQYTPPEKVPFKPRLDPSSWLADPMHRDQFVLRYSNPGANDSLIHETEVMWCERRAKPTLCYGGEREKEQGKSWCELYAIWSPQGTYLSTMHQPGIALWGGNGFEKQGRFAHSGVKHLKFSPCESYLMTCNFDESDRAIIIWEVMSGTPLRAFPLAAYTGGPASMFKWSSDGKYIARKAQDIISVFTLPSMRLLDRKSLKAEGVADFEWSPADPMLAYWAPEQDNSPARVSLVEIPSRVEVRQKNLVSVSECHLHWQEEGTYLCVKVLRHSKSKKTMYNNFELFRVKEAGIPVEMLELRSQVLAFAWEPCGDRFAIVHEEQKKVNEPPRKLITFYTMKVGEKMELQEVVTLEDCPANCLFWSPTGNVIILACMGDAPQSGSLMFYDVESQAHIKTVEHYRMTNIEWEPSGRYLFSAVTQGVGGTNWKAQMDNGYKLWTFQGEECHDFSKDNFYQVMWRPRPASLLMPEQKRDIIKNLRKYERMFEKLDREKERRKKREALRSKVEAKQAFRAMLAGFRANTEGHKAGVVSLRGGYDSDDESLYVIENKTREVVMDTNTVVM